MHSVTIEILCLAVRMRRRSARRMRRIAGSEHPNGLMVARATALAKEADDLADDLLRYIKDDETRRYVLEVLPSEP